jgi:hypothetical protein
MSKRKSPKKGSLEESYVVGSGKLSDEQLQRKLGIRAVTIQSPKRVASKQACRGPAAKWRSAADRD